MSLPAAFLQRFRAALAEQDVLFRDGSYVDGQLTDVETALEKALARDTDARAAAYAVCNGEKGSVPGRYQEDIAATFAAFLLQTALEAARDERARCAAACRAYIERQRAEAARLDSKNGLLLTIRDAIRGAEACITRIEHP